jgi:hypothetical protein
MSLSRFWVVECDGCGESTGYQLENPRGVIEGWMNGKRFTPLSPHEIRRRQDGSDFCPECSDELVVTHCGIIRERIRRKAGVAA